jgi:hypothetical protein
MPFLRGSSDPNNPYWWDPIDPGAVIDYVLAHYPGRIDVNRIYLTGMSRGTEHIMGWLSQDVNNGRRIAAAFIVANCFWSGVPDFTQRVSNLAASNVHIWGLSCTMDTRCDPHSIQDYVNGVNGLNPGHALYTGYTDPPPQPPPAINIDYCQGPNAGYHYAWNYAYSPAENRPAQTGGKNPYEWMIQFSQNSLLPITLKNWSARYERGNVLLEWTTSQEINSKEFLIQRATAASDFETILTVPAAVASSADRTYSIRDEHPLPGQSLYRLISIDQDGKQTIYAVRAIVVPGNWKDNVIIPNPINNGSLSVYLKVNKNQGVDIRLVDLEGRLLKQGHKQLLTGITQYTFDVTTLQKGSYIVQIIGEDFKLSKKITIE